MSRRRVFEPMLAGLTERYAASKDFIDRVMQTFLTKALLILASVVSGIIIARTLGPDGRGTYAVATAIGTIGAQFATLGLHASNTYLLARDRRYLAALVGNTVAVSIGAGGVLGMLLVACVLSGPCADLIQGDMLWLAVMAIPIYAALILLQNLLLGLYDTARFNATEIVENLVGLVLLIGLVVIGCENPFTVYGSSLLVSLGVAGVLARWLVVKAGGLSVSLVLLRENFGFSLRAYLSTLLFLLVARVDILLIAHFLDETQTGLYAVASSLGEMLAMIAVVTGNILFPRLVHEKDRAARWQMASRTALTIGMLVTLAGVISLPIAEGLVTLLFGEAYRPGASAYVYLVPGMICLSVNGILMNFYAAEGMPPIVVIAPMLAVVVKLALGVYLIPLHGVDGAALSATITYALVLLVTFTYLVGWRRRAAAVAA
jgi:O-antigen/teichoic acid export membrane protein